MTADDIPPRRILTNNIPPQRPLWAPTLVLAHISTVHSSASYIRGVPPDQLREVPRRLGIPGWFAEVVHVTFVAPGAN